MYETSILSTPRLLKLLRSLDTFPRWSHPHNRPTKDSDFLCPTAKIERHSCVRGRYHTHITTVAASRLSGGAVRNICALWGLLLNDRRLCGQHSSGGTIHTAGIGQGGRWAEKCRTTCLRKFGKTQSVYGSWAKRI